MNREQHRPIFIIAEAGVNHNGSLEMALELVEVAARAGVDAVKFQTFRAASLVGANAPKADYQKRTTGEAESQLEMIRQLELSEAAHQVLWGRCRELSLEFISTPFDSESLALLVRLGVSRLKIPSGEITSGPLLWEAARTGLPIILSTGMSGLGEIEEALGVLAFGYLAPPEPPSRAAFARTYRSVEGRRALQENVTLLHCTTEYPAPFTELNLRAMCTLAQAFGLPAGYSDHSEGLAASMAAAALGASVIEKHFTLNRDLPGPDHRASLEPDELKALVRAVRQTEKALGSPLKVPTASEEKNIPVARKSLVAARDIRAGELFTEENLTCKRPGSGISPMRYWEYLGTPAARDYVRGNLI